MPSESITTYFKYYLHERTRCHRMGMANFRSPVQWARPDAAFYGSQQAAAVLLAERRNAIVRPACMRQLWFGKG